MKKILKSKQKGITLIALVITIIVLLILAGVALSTITGNESAMNKATQARTENDRGAARDAASIMATGYIQEYMENKYSRGGTGLASATETTGEYVIRKMAGKTSGEFTFARDGQTSTLIINKGATEIERGTVNPDGTLTWGTTGNSGNNGGSGNEQQNNNNQGGGNTPTILPEDAVESLAKAGEIQRWDTINYDPGSATTASINLPEGASIEGTKLASVSLPSGASVDGTISATDVSNWVVLDVNQTTGEVLIMPRTISSSAGTLRLEGKDGYNNGVQALNAVAGIFKNPAYAESARSLTVEDINKVEGHTPDGNVAGPYNWNHRYGMNPTTLEITDAGEGNEPEQTYQSTATTGGEYYQVPSFGGLNYCWLASRYVEVCSSYCRFGLRILRLGDVYDGYYLFYDYSSDGANSASDNYSVVPVVTLKSNVQLESTSTFYTQTATATASVTGPTEYVHHTWSIKAGE